MLQHFENWLASKLHERAKSRALHRFGGIQRCPWCKQWAQLHAGWRFDSKTDPTIDALHCGNCGGVSRWRFEHGMMPLEPIGLSPPPVQLSSADVADESAKPLDTWPEYETDIPDAFDAYMTELVGNVDRRNWAHFPATFRWHEFWDHIGAAIARRGKPESVPAEQACQPINPFPGDTPNQDEIEVLRILNGEDIPGWTWGAAMSECCGWLKAHGYAEGMYSITEKGRQFLADLDRQEGGA